jgi:hypothetical protein
MLIESIAKVLSPVLESSFIKRVRRNHGLEHATIHMLNRQNYILSGRASAGGYIVIGDVPSEKIEAAAQDALARLKRGQAQLAVHPNCGTNLVTTGMLTTSIAALGFMGTNRRSAWERFPLVLLLMMGAALYSLPIGMSVQQHITTTGDMGEMEIIAVKKSEMRVPFQKKALVVHKIVTK